MKKLLYISCLGLWIACGGNTQKKTSDENNGTSPTTTLASPTESEESEIVTHYICPNRCKGSGSDAPGKCPVCGADYLHNDAFHQNNSASTPASENPSTAVSSQNTSTPATSSLTQTEIEALKKKGPEYLAHYVCPSYCKGSGSASAGKCPVCGKDYIHNDVYHQLNAP